LWADDDRFREHTDRHDWQLATAARFHDGDGNALVAGAGHRRRAAAEGWAHANGIESAENPGFLDWHQLNAVRLR